MAPALGLCAHAGAWRTPCPGNTHGQVQLENLRAKGVRGAQLPQGEARRRRDTASTANQDGPACTSFVAFS